MSEWHAHVGRFVRIPLPASKRKEQFAYGRICSIETYKDDNGERTWFYVRWINADGKPESEPMKHAKAELEPLE